jgi:hypothetical protein
LIKNKKKNKHKKINNKKNNKQQNNKKKYKVNDFKVNNIKVNNIKVNNIKVDDIKVNDIKVDDIKVDDIKVNNIKVNDNKELFNKIDNIITHRHFKNKILSDVKPATFNGYTANQIRTAYNISNPPYIFIIWGHTGLTLFEKSQLLMDYPAQKKTG